MDALLEGASFRYGYAVELEWADTGAGTRAAGGSADFDPHVVIERRRGADRPLEIRRADDETVAWHPGPGRRPSEPLFVRAADGHGDDEGWLLSAVDDVNRGTSDIYVLDASLHGSPGP